MTDTEKIFNKFKREEQEKTITVKSFTIDGKPVCYAWAGCDNHPQQVCQFLLTYSFGTQFECGLTGDKIHQNIDNFIEPVKNCPIWKDND